MLSYVLMMFGSVLIYQVSQDGTVVNYVAEDGGPLFDAVPIGQSAIIVDANPPRQSWMV